MCRLAGGAAEAGRALRVMEPGDAAVAFAAALLDPEAAVPEGLVDPTARLLPAFSVLSNNVAPLWSVRWRRHFHSAQAGRDEFFAAMRGRSFWPIRPARMLMCMATTCRLAGAFPPVAHLGYLPMWRGWIRRCGNLSRR